MFWSWPAQRPVAVYAAEDVSWGSDSAPDDDPVDSWILGTQRWSVRGTGTDSPLAENWGRYQVRLDMLENWSRIGTILQAPQIDRPKSKNTQAWSLQWYLEVGSQLRDTGLTPVEPFPNYATNLDPDPTR
ncbi:hypothetical protein XBLMG947_3625 [Xanthomonas bromi]|uniref:Uncharacterized protein n=1 Tax=Xanthomonas bromi TaxID=56449 RepID=A0A1C3NR03_9XANT|nr:hypothetical protein [Xanthomonas bromi]PPV08759.1 hypothetical protein XbrCFBP1976_01480 [Xanthomonas bromi]SBV52826.1 hypothetical protein XBLMG947_3625 [Xanthomonas bromi]